MRRSLGVCLSIGRTLFVQLLGVGKIGRTLPIQIVRRLAHSRRVYRYNVEEMTDMRRYWNKLYPQAPPADEAEIGPNCISKYQTACQYRGPARIVENCILIVKDL